MDSDRTDYDATAHISEEVKRAQVAAPAAIWIAVLGTGIAGWVYNIVFVLCSGDMADTGDLGFSGYAPAQILWMNVPRGLFYVLWAFICTVAFQVSGLGLADELRSSRDWGKLTRRGNLMEQVVATATHANARSFHAFSRDKGIPDRGFFARLAKNKVPVNAVWLVIFIAGEFPSLLSHFPRANARADCWIVSARAALMGLLVFASYVAVNAIFALAAMAMGA